MRRADPHCCTPRAASSRPLVLVSALLGPLLASILAAACTTGASAPPPARPPARVDLAGPAVVHTVVADTMTLVLMGTTDVHGRLANHDYYTGHSTDHGLAVLKPLIDSIRGAHPGRTMLFDSGDLLQGNPLGMVYARIHGDQPNPIIRAMNLLAYDAAAIGNHEFNYGLDHLNRAIELADFPFVSASIFHAGTDRHAYVPYVMLAVPTPAGDTVQVGVTGNTPPGVHIWDRDIVTGILEFRDVLTSVRAAVAELKAQGADVVVVLSHGGLEGTSYDTETTGLPPENVAAELARTTPEIDVIFLGHTHRELADTVIGSVLLTQARNWGASLATANLVLRRHGHGDWRVERRRGEIVEPRAGTADRAFLDSLRWEHERTLAYVNSSIGTASERMDARDARVRDTPIIDFINEVQRRTAGADLSATAAFRLDAVLPAGNISVANIAALYPYDNTLKAIRITGAQLRAYLEKSAEYYNGYPPARGGTVTSRDVPGYNFDIISGVDYTLDLTQPVGQRVVRLELDGVPVTEDRTFTLALNNYRQSGGGGYSMIAGAEVVYDRQEDIRELLIAEVRRRGVIRPEDYFRENWRIAPDGARDFAILDQVGHGPAVIEAPGGNLPTTNGDTIRKRLRVLSTNDFHGNLAPVHGPDDVLTGGAAALATYFRMEAEGFFGPTLILDGGDALQGTPVSNLTRGRSTIEYYNAAGYDAAAIGNHEFDWGADVLRDRMRDSAFPWLAANIVVAGSDTTPSWISSTAMLERDGVRAGILGLATGDTPAATLADNVRGLEFLDGAETMDRLVPDLRAAGADFVIVVAHAGARCETPERGCWGEMVDWLERTTERPDLVVAGHTHEVVRTRVNGVPVAEAGSWGRNYAVVDLERVTPDSVDAWIRGTPVARTDRVPPDSVVAAIVARAEHEVGPLLTRVVVHTAAEIPRARDESPMGRLIADAQRAATGTQIAIMNVGGVRAPMPAGAVTWGDLYRIQPFGNSLVVLQMTGSQLRRAIEHGIGGISPIALLSGIEVTYDPGRPPGSRVLSMSLTGGTPIQADETYSVTVNNFLATGEGDGFAVFAEAIESTPTGIIDLDALITYIESMPQPIRPPLDARLRSVSQGAP